MRIVINDANILMDLADLDMLDLLSSLEYEYHTTDLVIAEVDDERQQTEIDAFINKGKMIVRTFTDIEIIKISAESSEYNGLSLTDRSVLHYSKETNGILMTGDGKLRRVAQNAELEVRGILFIFDQLVEKNVITEETAYKKLKELYAFNSRLPVSEVEVRLVKWGKK
ncbi:MAG: hypothetical protein JXN63_03515 [Candidatus Delongbacteria bacterium]|nr:hypothetical protein [Candidatus Delongbacteria bacterium]